MTETAIVVQGTPVEQPEEQDLTTIQSLVVVIDRDASTKLPTTIFDYELPYLDVIYGEDHYEIVQEDEVDVPNFDVLEAYEGMRQKYKRHENEFDDVRNVYPDVRAFAKAIGLPAPDAKSVRARSVVVDHRKPAAKAPAKPGKKSASK